MERQWTLRESVTVHASAESVYAALRDLRNMARWSPECIGIRRLGRGPVAEGTRFLGFNRKGLFLWFTDCRVTTARAPHEFAFRVVVFGLPVARWGYLVEAAGTPDAVRVTEYWEDLRTGPGSRVTELLGRVFTGTRPTDRAALNRDGMRATLARLRATVEQPEPPARP
ncbi:SRPBCC family protein [Kitasatospora cheerisanensis]|uniref:Activator of Hsp90 ATPase 1 family protein n=1 Tax=Kitasatospora cheerisanensis KCTC 2395 TaxID=1348663 RepID=A0A066Z492_9ACTN|nr:SRPBCC family protein [Kitasatospora cheerisanensis]KDN87064.1 activator of Hsp90 ATPase 1 family protein [Kitasatospora cheerisanensis KCTC 2395]